MCFNSNKICGSDITKCDKDAEMFSPLDTTMILTSHHCYNYIHTIYLSFLLYCVHASPPHVHVRLLFCALVRGPHASGRLMQ